MPHLKNWGKVIMTNFETTYSVWKPRTIFLSPFWISPFWCVAVLTILHRVQKANVHTNNCIEIGQTVINTGCRKKGPRK